MPSITYSSFALILALKNRYLKNVKHGSRHIQLKYNQYIKAIIPFLQFIHHY